MKYLLPAFALLWLAMIYSGVLAGHEYVVATLSFPNAKTAVIDRVGPDERAFGLRPGMRIDLTHMSFAEVYRLRFGTFKGVRFQLPVVSGQTIQTLAVPALQQTGTEPLVLQVFDLVCMTFALLLAAFLAYRKPGVMIAALIIYLGAGGLSWPAFAVFLSGLPDQAYAAVAVGLFALCGWFPVMVLAAFAVRFPGDNPGAQKWIAIRIIDGIVILGFFAAVMDVLFGTRATYVGFAAFSGLTVVAASLIALQFAQSSDRARVGVVFASIMIGGAGYAANMIWLEFGGPFIIFVLYGDLAVVAVPLAVAYAMVRHRVFDIAFVLNRALIYAITSAVVLVGLAAMEFAAERYFSELTRFEGIAVEFGIALVIIVSVRLIHAWVDRGVDGMLFRTRHEQESALRRFATTLQFYTEQTPVIRDTVDVLIRFARVQGAAIYLPDERRLECVASAFPVRAPAIDENDPAHVELRAHHEQLQIQGVSTGFLGDRLYPMFLAGRLVGVISTGERESGEHMPPDIDDAIGRIASALAVSLAAIETDRIRKENTALQARIANVAVLR